jgi:hypothetical protein
MRTHTYLQYTSEMRIHTCVLRKKCSSTFFQNVINRRSTTRDAYSYVSTTYERDAYSYASTRFERRHRQIPAKSAGIALNVPVHFEGKNVAVHFSKLPILLDLDECKMHVKVPLNAFIVVFVQALDKQTLLSL